MSKTSRATRKLRKPRKQMPSAPSKFFRVFASIGENNEYAPIKKIIEIKLPCTLADLAYEVAEASFSACEELAFKANLRFLPAKEIRVETVIRTASGAIVTDRDIPF